METTIDKTMDREYNAARVAFDKAIAAGRLSGQRGVWNYAGDFMYMGSGPDGLDLFKHRDTRRYIGALPIRWEVMQ